MSAFVALSSVASAQTLADKLRDAGNMSFRMNNAGYEIWVGPEGLGCRLQQFASGSIGTLTPFVINFQSNTLNFQARIQDLVNQIASTALVNFTGSVVSDSNGTVVEWTADQTYNPTLCIIISISGTDYPFEIRRVFGKLRVQIAEGECVSDPLDLLGRESTLTLTPTGGDEYNYLGFDGWVPDGQCTARFFLACADANQLDFVAYGGDCPSTPGDVNGDGCVDDADLLAVLFAFGQTGSGQPEDVNGDGVVDDADLLTVLFNFGSGC
jgi:hypothetical protein